MSSVFPSSSTLFLGDLSVNCDEESLYRLFSSYGEIEVIQLKRSDRDPQRVHLGFGFIKFTTTEAAERALHALNGYFFLGRSIRVGWAEDPDNRTNRRFKGAHSQLPNISILRPADPKKNRQTAQIHVTFVSTEMNRRLSELELGKIFDQFGNLMDIAIKKNVVNPDQRTQSGYAFIHYSLSDEGIRSALMAVEHTNNFTYGHISFKSKITHSLQAQIFAMKRRISSQPVVVETVKRAGYPRSEISPSSIQSFWTEEVHYSTYDHSNDTFFSHGSYDSFQSPIDFSSTLAALTHPSSNPSMK